MFKEMRRHKQLLNAEETAAVLNRGTSGVLALSGEDGYPYAVPLSYVFDGEKLYFHSAKAGHKLEALRRCGATFLDGDGQRSGAGGAPITKADLLELGLAGPGSAARRQALQRRLGLPQRLTANGLLEALNLLYTREALEREISRESCE